MSTRKIICTNCGEPTEVNVHAMNAKYCPECAKIVERQMHAIHQKKRRLQRKMGAASAKEKQPQKTIAQLGAEARACGMSYGQYVAKIEGA